MAIGDLLGIDDCGLIIEAPEVEPMMLSTAAMITARDLQARSQAFAVDVLKLCAMLPVTPEGRNIRDQLGRAATSIAANYRATCRARSRDEFIAKLGLVVEEADEAHMWLEMIRTLQLTTHVDAERLQGEANELTAIFVASRRTAVSRHRHRRTSKISNHQ